mgnify:CR=1 FL=1
MSIDKLKTKFFTGAWLTDVKHYFTKINEIIDYLNGNGSSEDGSYKIYSGLITQNGSPGIAPTVKILKNTLGTITLEYNSLGVYKILSSGLFTIDKTFTLTGTPADTTATIFLNPSDSNELYYQTYSSGSASDGMISNTPIEIRVYN